MTYKDLHVQFLDGIKKTYTGTVHPNIFIRIFNDWAIPEWVANNVSFDEGVERTQKQVDDLDRITVTKEYPRITDNKIQLPDDYIRLTSIMVKIGKYACDKLDVSEYERIYREMSDQKSYNYQSFFRKPSKHRPYYKQIGEVVISGSQKTNNNSMIHFIPGKNNHVVACEIEYIRRPDNLPPYNNTDWVDREYIDFRKEQLLEVINVCIRLYLERVKDERYQTFLNEQNIRNIQKL
jgi:hypothetical protein